jgi:hypothetical protein
VDFPALQPDGAGAETALQTKWIRRNYVKHTLFSKKKYGQGTTGIITNIHKGPLCGITHLDVRLPEGEFVREVPIDYFLA